MKTETPEWDVCEDCMGSGRISIMFGGGECHCFNGRMSTNEAAEGIVRDAERRFQERIRRLAARDVNS